MKVCCVCGHDLDWHIDEEKWWRCHLLGADYYQCECRLLKIHGRKKNDYNVEKRAREYVEEEMHNHQELLKEKK